MPRTRIRLPSALKDCTRAYAFFKPAEPSSGARWAALCGLSTIALAEGDQTQAQRHTAELLHGLEADQRVRFCLGLGPHLVCYRVLRASGDPRASEILEQAYRLLQERAHKIEDEELRRSYLENVAANREIASEWANRK